MFKVMKNCQHPFNVVLKSQVEFDNKWELRRRTCLAKHQAQRFWATEIVHVQ